MKFAAHNAGVIFFYFGGCDNFGRFVNKFCWVLFWSLESIGKTIAIGRVSSVQSLTF